MEPPSTYEGRLMDTTISTSPGPHHGWKYPWRVKGKSAQESPTDSSKSHASPETSPEVPPVAASATSQTPNRCSETDPLSGCTHYRSASYYRSNSIPYLVETRCPSPRRARRPYGGRRRWFSKMLGHPRKTPSGMNFGAKEVRSVNRNLWGLEGQAEPIPM